MAVLNTDFNVSPYFDDYEEAKKYYRILFRPSVAVQARELTQLQTMSQVQIERFGNHIFKDGSVVEGCAPTEFPNLDFVRVADAFTANANAFVSDITSDYLLVGQSSNVRAVAVVAKTGSLIEYPDTNRFYVKYLTTGANNETTFANSEVINIYNENQNKLGVIDANNLINTINVISSNATVNAVGKGYGFRVENGIVYHKGFFQLVDDQIIIVRDYDQNVGNTVVGFDSIEEIINENQDESLNDNALGYSNENAPGAHRLKLTTIAVAKERTDISNNENFFAVFEFSNISNSLVLNKTQTPYEQLGEVFEKRTYDESGDYVVKPFITETVEGSNTSTFAYQVSSGKGYVHGAQIEYLAARKVEVDRATTTLEANQQIITTNYGNYVYVNEYSGALNFSDFITVDIYDAPLTAITSRFTPSLAGKNKIGSAKVKSVVHDEGDAGLPDTTYRVFLSDIIMNSGKSFSADAKSLYANGSVNAFGPFYGDIELFNSRAILEESGKTSLVFPFGKNALKTLRSSNGSVNNTEFYFRTSSNATLQTNGFIAVTTSSSYTGGVDRIGYSTGVLGDAIEEQFFVTVTSNVSTANITGTINLNSTNTSIITSGLNTHFANGEFIKIYANSSTIDFRRVVSVNSTAMVVDVAPSTTNTTANFGKHFPAGYNIPLDNIKYPGTRQVNVTSNTTFEVSTGAASSAALENTANVTVQYRMLRVQANQAKKDVKKNRFVKLLANSSTNNSWNLGLPDVYKLKRVYANTTNYSELDSDEVTNYFAIDNGQRSDYYDHGRLVIKPQYTASIPTNAYLTVVVDHFSANLNNGVGFFSVDSYPVDDANTANTNAIQTAEIPVFVSGETRIDLRDAVDFRAYKANTANSSTTLAGATVNPATTNTFISFGATYLAEPDTNFQSDIEYYLGRIDLVTLSSTGGLGVIKGTPAENPKTPVNNPDTMILATANVPPYPTLTAREAETFRRLDYATRTRISTNRGYTMRDIGLLDQRIERLEYYTTLNLLEQKAQNIQVPDASGLNRFKNGIFADPMSSHIFAQSNDLEYRFSIDSGFGYGRPLFSSENVDLTFSNSSSNGVQLTGKILTRPYTNELFIFQPFATKFRNNTQDLWAWKGSLELYPQYDMNRDETRLPNIDASIDLTQPFIQFANVISEATGATIFGTRWGDWRTTSATTTSVALDSRNTLFTQTTEQQRVGTNTFIVPMTQTFDLGSYVTDVSVQPYMKSRLVAFVARNLKPNTRIYAFFDDTDVTEYCAPGELNTSLGNSFNEISSAAAISGSPENVVNRTGNFGQALVTDNIGTLYGIFRIPEGTFRTGDRQLQLVDADNLVTGSDAYITRAAATFTASNISISTRNATISSVTPEVRQTSFSDARVTINTWIREPIAQSLLIEAPEEQSGVFVTKLDLFFKRKDPNLGIQTVMVGMINGVPDSSTVYGIARVSSDDVNVSDDASSPTEFVFDHPIFLSADKEYAFFIEPEGGSPEYQMWMSETGGFDVITGAQVYKNPYCGDAFRSSNSRTWTALPKEDVKFNLYVANFQVGTGTATFENETDEYITYSGLAVANSSLPVAVGDEVYLINSIANASITNTNITGVVQFIDTTNNKMKLNNSTGGFANTNTIGIFRFPQQGNTSQANSTTLIATTTITTVDNPVLHSIVPRFATAIPLGTNIDYNFRGTTNSAVIETSYHELSNDNEREMLDFERRVYSYSSELNSSINKSLQIRSTLTNTNKYLSPVIDLSRKSALVIKNIINNDNTDEHTRYGNSLAKYISQPIILADGQEAEDLKIYVSAYRPINTDVEVYVKFLNPEDSGTLDSKVWTKLVPENPELRSSPINRFDFREYVYNVPTTSPVTNAAFKNNSNFGIVEYVDENGAIYQSFKTFSIKIVLLSTDGVYVPKINDLRGIALQV
jgi:hypothetical protein